MNLLRWIVSAAVSAWACWLAVEHVTPIDAALPAIAVAVTLFAALSHPGVMVGVPLLVVAQMAVADDTLRLGVVGAVVAVAATVALVWVGGSHKSYESHGTDGTYRTYGTYGALLLTVTLIMLLRWIPFTGMRRTPEVLLLLLCCGIVWVLGRTPFAVVVAVITALVTPGLPLRTLLLPVTVLFVSALARFFGMPRLRLAWPSAVVIAFVALFFPWSGIVARAFPYFLKPAPVVGERHTVGYALPANKTEEIAVPERARALIVSGANVAGFGRGKVLGRIEPGGIVVRIGDVADWGYLRREAFRGSRNPLPRDPVGFVRDYGYAAWVDGAGRIPLPRNARVIRVTGDAALPPGASIQIEAFELAPR